MNFLEVTTVLIVLTALLGYLNVKIARLPITVGIMLSAMALSLALAGADAVGFKCAQDQIKAVIVGIDFDNTLLNFMLAFLLFAGSLHIKLDDLLPEKKMVLFLSTVSVLLSTVIVGGCSWALLRAIGHPIQFLHCLLFGALISPTDPVAVLDILKRAGIPKAMETRIAGESLFNDGVGVVLFTVLLELASGQHGVSGGGVAMLFVTEALGGALFGFAIGTIAYHMLKSIDEYQVEILITLALVMGGYRLAALLHVSGAIAMVVAGLFIGNHGRDRAMSQKTRDHLDSFWDLVDGILNALLFLLMGLELQVMTFQPGYLLAGLGAIVISLFARWVSVSSTWPAAPVLGGLPKGSLPILTWCGVRGGISIALALSLPDQMPRDLILVMTYLVVVFSVVGQGLTLGHLVNRYYPGHSFPSSEAGE